MITKLDRGNFYDVVWFLKGWVEAQGEVDSMTHLCQEHIDSLDKIAKIVNQAVRDADLIIASRLAQLYSQPAPPHEQLCLKCGAPFPIEFHTGLCANCIRQAERGKMIGYFEDWWHAESRVSFQELLRKLKEDLCGI